MTFQNVITKNWEIDSYKISIKCKVYIETSKTTMKVSGTKY